MASKKIKKKTTKKATAKKVPKQKVVKRRGRPPKTDAEKAADKAARAAAKLKRRIALHELAANARRHAEELEAEAERSAPSKKKKSAQEPFVPTARDRQQVETLAGLGLRLEEICVLVENPSTGRPITEKTLRKHFERELSTGPPKANSLVAQSLLKRAQSNEGKSAVTAAIWWTKCRMGWKERIVAEVEVKSGVLVPPAGATPEEWLAGVAAANARKKEPGAEPPD